MAALVGAVVLSQLGAAGASPPLPVDAPIRLLADTFYPTRGEAPDIPPGLTIAGYAAGQRGYHIVQFVGPVHDEWKAAAADAGAELLAYLPENAFKVRMTPGEAEAVEALPGVAWVGLFHPAYKISPRADDSKPGLFRVVVERGGDAAAAVAALESSGVAPLRRDRDTLLVLAPPGRLNAMAHVLDVAWIEPFDIPVTHNEQGGGVIMGGSAAHTRGYDGSTQIVAVADTGIGDGTAAGAHPDIPASRIVAIYDWTSADIPPCYDIQPDGPQDVDSGHGTHTAVSAVGDGGAGGIGTGTAPGASLVFQAVEDFIVVSNSPVCGGLPDGYYLIGLPLDLHSLYQQAYDDGARAHSNSWGFDDAGAYNEDSASTDDFVFDNPTFIVTYSAGNAGVDASPVDGVIDPGSVGSPATAKNVIAVGASEGVRLGGWPCDSALTYLIGETSCELRGGSNAIFTWGEAWPEDYPAAPWFSDPSAGDAEQMAAFSSRGPTDDGRIKPDVVAPGTWILSGYSSEYQQGYGTTVNPANGLYQYDGWGFPLDSAYKYMGGTSMSNPLVAGGAAVVADFYQKAHTHDASAALVKATLINSARDLLDENNDGVDDNDFPIPNIHEGWGIVDLDRATDGSHQWVDNTAGLATSGTATFEYEVVAAGMPFKVSLVWSDYPSAETAEANLVNDLDLQVTAPDGTTVYRGNTNFVGGWSQPSATPDQVNNVENVYVSSAAAGTWTVTVHGSNIPMGPQPFSLVVDGDLGAPPTDTTPPLISNVPANTTVEATGPGGAVATYSSPTATDDVDGPVPVICSPTSGSTFPLGTTTVNCSATDTAGNIGTATFTVTVEDTTPPTVSNVPANMTVEATGPSGAVVPYSSPTASDLVDGTVAAGCSPVSGSTFPLGTTTVDCTATDTAGNTAIESFTVTVEDTTAPVLGTVPANVTVEATGPTGAAADYTDPTATDSVDIAVDVGCSPPSGSTFSLGTTTVTCTATDDSGNIDSDTFTITVEDTTAPVLGTMPANITTEATGPTGAVVDYSAPTAADTVDTSVDVSCSAPSGSIFSLGTTTVTCTATDDSGNIDSDTFMVTVEDTMPPLIGNIPANVTVEATEPDSAVVTFTNPTATDLVDGSVMVTCEPPSGSTFNIGTTTVTCTAIDTAGNSATATFDITVVEEDATPPVISGVPADITEEATGPAGAVATYPSPTANDDVDGSVAVNCSPVSGSTFPLGTTIVTCTATDTAGNTGTADFAVTVEDTTPPAINNVPDDITTHATGPSGAAVTYPSPTATDLVEGTVPVTCIPGPGATFPIGTTAVTCTATDSATTEAIPEGPFAEASGNPGTATFDVTVVDPAGVIRYAGGDRYGTAGAIAHGDFPSAATVDVVFVAYGGNFPDAVAGAAVAGKMGAPLLLVRSDGIPGATAFELQRLAPDEIVILGGTGVISMDVEAALHGYAARVVRLAGGNRYTTSVEISEYGYPQAGSAETVIVATGLGFADALAAGPAAVVLDGPVLLTDPDALPLEVAAEITRLGPSRIIVVGGTTAVSNGVLAELQGLAVEVERISGSNRYETAIRLSMEAFQAGAHRVYLATGLSFPDGLAGGAGAGWWHAPVLLVPGDEFSEDLTNEIIRLGADKGIVLGGQAVISVGVEDALVALIV